MNPYRDPHVLEGAHPVVHFARRFVIPLCAHGGSVLERLRLWFVRPPRTAIDVWVTCPQCLAVLDAFSLSDYPVQCNARAIGTDSCACRTCYTARHRARIRGLFCKGLQWVNEYGHPEPCRCGVCEEMRAS